MLQLKVKKRLKVSTFIYRHLQGNPGQQQFTIQSGVLTGSDTGGTAQVAAAHCPNEHVYKPQFFYIYCHQSAASKHCRVKMTVTDGELMVYTCYCAAGDDVLQGGDFWASFVQPGSGHP